MMKQKHIQLVFLIAAIMMIVKAAQIQLLDNSYKIKAEKATLESKIKYPSRGLVYDRNGKLLVSNTPIYNLKLVYNELDPQMDTAKFCRLLDISRERFEKLTQPDWSSVRFNKRLPFTFLKKISPDIFAGFQEHLHEFPGFYPELFSVRAYPHQNAPHLLGYMGEVDKEQIKSSDRYSLGDYTGINGIEKQYEELLRGEKGIEYILKDNLGREVEKIGKGDSSAVSGKDLISSIDLDLQAYGEKLMQNKVGSIVAIEPSTGEILSMISAPSFDPNLLSVRHNRGEAFRKLLQDTLTRPMLDRSIMAKYPPGSIFKPILSLIALQEGVTKPNRTIYCEGYYEYRHFQQGCHEHSTPWNVQIALQHSCNSYFLQLCRDLVEKYGFNKPGPGLNLMVEHLKDFGLGVKLGIDNMHENRGFVPDATFYDRLYPKEVSPNGWRSTYIMSLGIGQGELELTTLQMANLAAIMANKGHYYTPHLIKAIKSENGDILDVEAERKEVRIDKEHFEPVIDGMERVITMGTARSAYVPGISICGKTGTSENPHGKDHSVFFAFAPKENPQIAVAVFIENAGFGGDVAAPIAGLFIEQYLNKEISKNRKWWEERMINLEVRPNP